MKILLSLLLSLCVFAAQANTIKLRTSNNKTVVIAVKDVTKFNFVNVVYLKKVGDTYKISSQSKSNCKAKVISINY